MTFSDAAASPPLFLSAPLFSSAKLMLKRDGEQKEESYDNYKTNKNNYARSQVKRKQEKKRNVSSLSPDDLVRPAGILRRVHDVEGSGDAEDVEGADERGHGEHEEDEGDAGVENACDLSAILYPGCQIKWNYDWAALFFGFLVRQSANSAEKLNAQTNLPS